MPVPTSKRQFRWLQAVAHRKAKMRQSSLKPEQARQGLQEFKASHKNYGSLPERAGNARRAGARRRT